MTVDALGTKYQKSYQEVHKSENSLNTNERYQEMRADQTYDGPPEVIPPDPALSDLIDCT